MNLKTPITLQELDTLWLIIDADDSLLFEIPKRAVEREPIEVVLRAVNAHADLLRALRRLALAAECRDNTMGDPVRLLDVKAELQAAADAARQAIAKAETR